MSDKICDMDCLHCKFSDCINDSDELSPNEVIFSVGYDTFIKSERRKEAIEQIDNPKARAMAKYRQTPKGKEAIHRMNTNELGKARFKRYEQSDKGKARRKRHEAKPERQAYRKSYMKEYNKALYKKQKAEKEVQRMYMIAQVTKELSISGSVIIRGKKKNRPRERKILDDVLSFLNNNQYRWTVEYNEDLGSLHRKEHLV